MLRAHRADQEAERLAAANQWQDRGLVFATEFGTPVDPRNILRTIQIAAQKGEHVRYRSPHTASQCCRRLA